MLLDGITTSAERKQQEEQRRAQEEAQDEDQGADDTDSNGSATLEDPAVDSEAEAL